MRRGKQEIHKQKRLAHVKLQYEKCEKISIAESVREMTGLKQNEVRRKKQETAKREELLELGY